MFFSLKPIPLAVHTSFPNGFSDVTTLCVFPESCLNE